MKTFLDEKFMLQSETAIRLYEAYAKDMPIIDYHCHILPEQIAKNIKFNTITEVWLYGDHYKWRQMRLNGIDEKYITGDASDFDKFYAFAQTLEKAIGNPLFHWSHLELKRYFGYDGVLTSKTAKEVWEVCNEKLQKLSARDFITNAKVEMIGTTDDPIDDLKWHKEIQKETDFKTKVLPSFRPDKAINIELDTFKEYIKLLGAVTEMEISSFEQVKEALSLRMKYFNELGCKVSDHGLNYVCYQETDEAEVNAIFNKKLNGEDLTEIEIDKYKTAIMVFLGGEYTKYNWVMQLHYGCRRNNNTKMFELLGADTGFDCINNDSPANQLIKFLDVLYEAYALPKTIIYPLNPMDNDLVSTIIGCFAGGIKGKIQHGSAWWFNDTKTGMEAQMTSLANLGLLGNFIGMLTDSRSFLSYTRHEYFRRILCNLIGDMVEKGEYPNDDELLQPIIEGICYQNAKEYFGI